MLPQPARLLRRVTWLDLMFTVTRLLRAFKMRTCGVTLMRTSSPHKSRKVSPDLRTQRGRSKVISFVATRCLFAARPSSKRLLHWVLIAPSLHQVLFPAWCGSNQNGPARYEEAGGQLFGGSFDRMFCS